MENVHKGKRILIYGTGAVCRELLDEPGGYEVRGILDRVRMWGEMDGIPILTWEDVPEGYADAVVIAAPRMYLREIYFRILPYCMDRGLEILSVGGQSLTRYYGARFYEGGFLLQEESMEELRKKLPGYDLVSFDIFDTLLARRVFEPADVFDLVERRVMENGIVPHGFKKARREAELRSGGGNLYEIYGILGKLLDLSDEQARAVLEWELSCEREVLFPRPGILELFGEAVKNASVVLTSDMYLPPDILAEILHAKGIAGFEKIYVSCEYGTYKQEALFGKVREDYPTARCIHIGDDIWADREAAVRWGMDAAYIGRASERLRNSVFMNLIGKTRSLADRLMLGEISARLFQNIRAESCGMVKTCEDYVSIYFRPLVLAYLQLLEDKAAQGYDALLFVARDGYLIYRIYEKLRSEGRIRGPEAHYMLCSRKLVIRAAMRKREDIQEVLRTYKGFLTGMKHPVQNIFGVAEEGHYEEDKMPVEEYVMGYADAILEHSERTRKGYLRWLDREGIDLSRKNLFCEFNGFGNSQYYFSLMAGREVDAIYLVREMTDNGHDLPCEYVFRGVQGQYCALTEDNTMVLEGLFSSGDASVDDMTEEGIPVFLKETRLPEIIGLLEKMQGILLDETVEIYRKHREDAYRLTRGFMEALFDSVKGIGLGGECGILKSQYLLDDFKMLDLRVF